VCLVTHRFGGHNGVAREADKWRSAAHTLGWHVTRAGGLFLDHAPGDVVVRGMWADRPGAEPPPVDHPTIRRLCADHDLVILDNAGTLFSAPLAARAWQEHALAVGVPVVLRHHDPPWQGAPLRPVTGDALPLHDRRHLHVLINERTRRDFAHRWPELVAADALQVVHNRVDTDGLRDGNRAETRAGLGVGPDELLVAHPARADGPSKNIPGAVDFAAGLAARHDRRVRYWLTDDLPDPPTDVRHALAAAPGLVRGPVQAQADLYAAADVVVLSSTWEGWGLPVVEAAAARKVVVAGPYPVLAEIHSFGLATFALTDTTTVLDTLHDPDDLRRLLDANETAVRRHFDLAALPAILAELTERAGTLAGRG